MSDPNTYNWKVVGIEVMPSYEIYENVVSIIRWKVEGTDGTKSADIASFTEISPDFTSTDRFVPYEELTEEEVLSWAHTTMGEEVVEIYHQAIDRLLAEQYTPDVTPVPLPWS